MEETMKQGFKPADYKNSQNARWCPGCGDHAILNVLHKAMAELGDLFFPGPNNVKEVPQHGKARRTCKDHSQM